MRRVGSELLNKFGSAYVLTNNNNLKDIKNYEIPENHIMRGKCEAESKIP